MKHVLNTHISRNYTFVILPNDAGNTTSKFYVKLHFICFDLARIKIYLSVPLVIN